MYECEVRTGFSSSLPFASKTMGDPISITLLVCAVVSAIGAGAHMFRRLWDKLKGFLGASLYSQCELSLQDSSDSTADRRMVGLKPV